MKVQDVWRGYRTKSQENQGSIQYSQALGFTLPGVTSHFSIGLTTLLLCISFEVVTNCGFQHYYSEIHNRTFVSPSDPKNYRVEHLSLMSLKAQRQEQRKPSFFKKHIHTQTVSALSTIF